MLGFVMRMEVQRERGLDESREGPHSGLYMKGEWELTQSTLYAKQ